MKTIWQFHLGEDAEKSVGAPDLHVGVQRVDVCIYADPSADTPPRAIRVYGVGHPMPDIPGTYIGTFILVGGPSRVFHAYEE